MEDYKEKYEKSVEKLKKFFTNDDDRILYKRDIERVFPELKESEDEKIRCPGYPKGTSRVNTDHQYKGVRFYFADDPIWQEKIGKDIL